MQPEPVTAAALEEAAAKPATAVKVTPIPPPAIPPPAILPPAIASPTMAPPSTAPSPSAATSPRAAASPASTAPSASAATAVAPPPPPPPAAPLSSIPQKRALADDPHTPAVRSPLNPEARLLTPQPPSAPEELPNVAVREKRAKKDSLKKRESKAALAGWDTAGARSPAPEAKRKETAAAAPDDGPNGTEAAAPCKAKQAAKAAVDDLPTRVRLAGPLRPTDFEPPASPIFRSRHSIPVAGGREIAFFELLTEQPINRRGYVYESAIADPRFPALHHFRQTEPKPHCAHLSFEDAPASMFFDQAGLHVTGEGGFRTARANTAVRQGRWYWECRVTRGIVRTGAGDGNNAAGKGQPEPEARGHVRMGWARREASRDAPVGCDAYGYGLRDRRGQKVHMSRPKEFLGEGVDVCEGDVVGLEIALPSEALHRKVVRGTYNPAVDREEAAGPAGADDGDGGPNVVRDRIPFRFQQTKPVFEKFDYQPVKELEDLANPAPTLSASSAGAVEPPNPHHAVPCLRTLPGSCIRVYVNGVLQGTPFADLLAFLPPASTTNAKLQEGAREGLDDGTLGYYPAVSTFRGGAAEVNFGPAFWFPPPGLADGTIRPVSDRYAEQIAEDIVYDIVDEAYFWLLDGGGGGQPAGPAAGETKEVVMED